MSFVRVIVIFSLIFTVSICLIINDEFVSPNSFSLNTSKYQNFYKCLPLAHSLSQPTNPIWTRLSTIIQTSETIR